MARRIPSAWRRGNQPTGESAQFFVLDFPGRRIAIQWGKSDDGKQIRCPSRVADGQFKMMEARPGDWFICTVCGHVTLASNPGFECACPKRRNLRRIK